MPLIPITAWFKKWLNPVAPTAYVEWITPLSVSLISIDAINTRLPNIPTASLMPNSMIDVVVHTGDENILVKMVSKDMITVAVK
jgi:hypothetical protein